MEIVKIVILSLSGLMLSFAGLMRLVKPIKSYCLKAYSENPKIKLEGEVDVLNEMRGEGAVTLFAGIIILLGTITPELRLTSFVVAIVIFLGFTIGRAISMFRDGKPNKELVQGFFAEIIFSTLNIFCLINILF